MSTSGPDGTPSTLLMVSGRLTQNVVDEAAEVRRGAPVLDAGGQPAGSVAGVLVDGETDLVVRLVLGRDAAAGDYRLIPTDQIARVDDGTVRLRLAASDLTDLPIHHPD